MFLRLYWRSVAYGWVNRSTYALPKEAAQEMVDALNKRHGDMFCYWVGTVEYYAQPVIVKLPNEHIAIGNWKLN